MENIEKNQNSSPQKSELVVQTSHLLEEDFGVVIPENTISDEAMLKYLSEVIEEMIQSRMDFLLSLLYRLDVREKDIQKALLPGNPLPANIALADLVWERQKERLRTKALYKKSFDPSLEGFEW
jgi:hypothetical protein